MSYNFLTYKRILFILFKSCTIFSRENHFQQFLKCYSLYLNIHLSSTLQTFKIYILQTEIFLSLTGGCCGLFSCQFSAVYLSFHIQSVCSFVVQHIWYDFCFHQCMMKELTIIFNPDFQFQLLTLNDIFQICPVETSDTKCIIIILHRTIGQTILLVSLLISKGNNKT